MVVFVLVYYMEFMLTDSDSYQTIAVGLIVGSGARIYFYFVCTVDYDTAIDTKEREVVSQILKKISEACCDKQPGIL